MAGFLLPTHYGGDRALAITLANRAFRDDLAFVMATMQPCAWRNGEFIPSAERLSIPVYDAGFILGVTVTEQVRTFRGEPYRLEERLARLRNGLRIVGLEIPFTETDLAEAARELARRNHALLDPDDDLGLAIFVTPGAYATLAPHAVDVNPLVAMHTYPLPFGLWHKTYTQGQTLVTTSVQQVPELCWPRHLKCRSRMHYYLADRQARETDPRARALLLDADGCVTETSTSNILVYSEEIGFRVPPSERVLPGVSQQALREIIEELGHQVTEHDLTPADVAASDEVLLTSTPSCLLPVTRLNDSTIGAGQPGPLFQRLLTAWSEKVDVDIRGQAERFAAR